MVLVSHKHKLIYIKTFKTASTATECFLQSALFGDNLDSLIQKHFNPYTGLEENHAVHDEVETHEKIVGKRGKGKTKRGIWFNHMDACSIRKELGQEIFDSYIKASSFRNPYDQVVSYSESRKKENRSFKKNHEARV